MFLFDHSYYNKNKIKFVTDEMKLLNIKNMPLGKVNFVRSYYLFQTYFDNEKQCFRAE